jgi:uncharacterized membrane protein YeaQ/YmgE (transglycosylase-associated protein family)
VGVDDYLIAIAFGAVLGVVARIIIPGKQRIGFVLTVLIGMGAAVAGTWLCDRFGLSSDATFEVLGRTLDWLVIGVQVGIAVVGVALAALLAPTFDTDRRANRRSS